MTQILILKRFSTNVLNKNGKIVVYIIKSNFFHLFRNLI